MLTLIAVLEIVTVVAGSAAFFVIRNLTRSLKSYSEEKGKNLATKEDIAEITRKVESVRAEYAEKLQALTHENTLVREAFQRRHQLSMAALDKRLEAHQTAYSLWWQTSSEAVKEDSSAFFMKCQSWWVEHCLYLSEEANMAFLDAFHAGTAIAQFRQQHAEGDFTSYWDRIYSAGDVIRKAVYLPPLSREVAEELRKADTSR